MAKSIDDRRKIRALEARRDKLLQTKQSTSKNLALVRTELAHAKKK